MFSSSLEKQSRGMENGEHMHSNGDNRRNERNERSAGNEPVNNADRVDSSSENSAIREVNNPIVQNVRSVSGDVSSLSTAVPNRQNSSTLMNDSMSATESNLESTEDGEIGQSLLQNVDDSALQEEPPARRELPAVSATSSSSVSTSPSSVSTSPSPAVPSNSTDHVLTPLPSTSLPSSASPSAVALATHQPSIAPSGAPVSEDDDDEAPSDEAEEPEEEPEATSPVPYHLSRWKKRKVKPLIRTLRVPTMSNETIRQQQILFNAFLNEFNANQTENSKEGRILVYRIHKDAGLGNMIRGYITAVATSILTNRALQGIVKSLL